MLHRMISSCVGACVDVDSAVRFLRSPSVVVREHRTRVLTLYRSILELGARFPDEVASDYIIWRARQLFHRRCMETSLEKARKCVSEGMTARRQIAKALEGDVPCFVRILEYAYGHRGRLKHVFEVRSRCVLCGDSANWLLAWCSASVHSLVKYCVCMCTAPSEARC
jgi:hypothetical protein